jgi:hypothetical protein
MYAGCDANEPMVWGGRMRQNGGYGASGEGSAVWMGGER